MTIVLPGPPKDRISYLDGPLGMEQRIFDVARDVVEHPSIPGHSLPPEIYCACLVVEYCVRKIEKQQVGQEPGAYFVCPECRVELKHDAHVMTWRCPNCNNRVTDELLQDMFVKGVYIPPGAHSSKTADPDNYEPSLTSPIPRDLDIEKLEQIQENATQEEEPVVMYRAWKLQLNSMQDGMPVPTLERLLLSINNVKWEPRHPLLAIHHPNGHRHDDPTQPLRGGGCPNWHCQCGIYGVKTLAQAQKWSKMGPRGDRPNSHTQVVGKVVMWGKVLQYQVGAKAEYAYPEQLWLSPTMLSWGGEEHPERLAEELAAKYGIPVNLEDGMYDLGLSHT